MNIVVCLAANAVAVGIMLWYQHRRFKRYKRDFEQHMKGQQNGADG